MIYYSKKYKGKGKGILGEVQRKLSGVLSLQSNTGCVHQGAGTVCLKYKPVNSLRGSAQGFYWELINRGTHGLEHTSQEENKYVHHKLHCLYSLGIESQFYQWDDGNPPEIKDPRYQSRADLGSRSFKG